MIDAEHTAAKALLLSLVRSALEQRVQAAIEARRELERHGPRTSRIRRLNDAETAERVARGALALVHASGS